MGLVFNIQRFSIHDGTGIRTTVFLKGCPLACPWCSNPESLRAHPEIITRDVKCIRCGRCAEACPRHAIEMRGDSRIIHFEDCDACLECVQACPARAIEQVGRTMSVEQVMAVVSRDRGFYRQSAGGLTISGGEPLLQGEFTRELAHAASQVGIPTALETSGFAPWEELSRVLEFIDLVLFDLKQVEDGKHQAAVGVSNTIILENLRQILIQTSVPVWIRIPVLPGFNDSAEALAAMEDLVAALPRPVEKVSLLPLHQFGEGKYRALGRRYSWQGVEPPTPEKMEAIRASFEKRGFAVEIGR